MFSSLCSGPTVLPVSRLQIRLEREQQVEKLKKSLDQESAQKAAHVTELKQKYGQQASLLKYPFFPINNFTQNSRVSKSGYSYQPVIFAYTE